MYYLLTISSIRFVYYYFGFCLDFQITIVYIRLLNIRYDILSNEILGGILSHNCLLSSLNINSTKTIHCTEPPPKYLLSTSRILIRHQRRIYIIVLVMILVMKTERTRQIFTQKKDQAHHS